jgi:hypothetical protein
MPALHSCQACYSYCLFLPVHSEKYCISWLRDTPVYKSHNYSGKRDYKTFPFHAVNGFSCDFYTIRGHLNLTLFISYDQLLTYHMAIFITCN